VWFAAASVAVCVSATARGQLAPASTIPAIETPGFQVNASVVHSWQDGATNVITITGPVVIRTDDSVLRADNAVVWLEPAEGFSDAQRAGIALIGNAQIESTGAVRSGNSLYATTLARGNIRFEAQQRVARDDSTSPLYQAALALREEPQTLPQVLATQPIASTLPANVPVRAPQRDPLAALMPPGSSVRFKYDSLTPAPTGDDRAAYALRGVHIFYRWPDGAYAELMADRAVAFTNLRTRAGDPTPSLEGADSAMESVYLEGDVRILYVPPTTVTRMGEQRMSAHSAYFRMADRTAVLTQAVLHTEDLKSGMPFVLRARTLKQVSEGKFEAQGVQLTTSQFYRPSFAIEASKIYVHQNAAGATGGEDAPTSFRAINPRFKFLGVPLFYLPVAGGQVTGRGAPIRDATVTTGDIYGLGVKTSWGLFETVGAESPRGLDAQYRLDYFDKRGPAGGLFGDYRGGFVSETERSPVDFLGEYDAYFLYEHGVDILGSGRSAVDPGYKDIRGVAGFRHQHFFPDGWQLQLQSWYVSDATFLESWQYYEDEFDTGYSRESSLYLKRQQNNEAFTFLVSGQPNSVVTTADLQQEQFEVEKLPELSYHLIGAGLGNAATFYSDNSVAGLHMRTSDATLAEQGFIAGQSTPGIPSLGITGIAEDPVYRGDFRQEVTFPFSLGQVKAVPYVVGRYTPYSEGTDGGVEQRVYGGVGARFTTAFWSVNDKAYSDLLDIHRLRHVIQPELHMFAGYQSTERNDVYVFEEPIDDIHDINAVQLSLRQRWQTKRGGPGRWHSSDVFTLNTEFVFYGNRPEQATIFQGQPLAVIPPQDFRGAFFPSIPESSIPRDSMNIDGTWRLSDSTVIIGDMQYNLEVGQLATTSIGLNVQRNERLRYYLGYRFIQPFDSQIATIAADYQLTPKYRLSVNQSYDFGQDSGNVNTAITLTRKFDKFYLQLSTNYNSREDENSFSFNFVPEGVPISSAVVQSYIPQQ